MDAITGAGQRFASQIYFLEKSPSHTRTHHGERSAVAHDADIENIAAHVNRGQVVLGQGHGLAVCQTAELFKVVVEISGQDKTGELFTIGLLAGHGFPLFAGRQIDFDTSGLSRSRRNSVCPQQVQVNTKNKKRSTQ
jgi:hypothetical protein